MLVEAAAGAVSWVDFFAFHVAEAFGVLGGVVGALLLFGGGEAALLAAAEAFVRGHAFEEEFGGGDGEFG